MRPRRISLRGLRSYREPVQIDFSDIGLMAIVGDTGAGKSSILEAITYGLYNGTTWSQRDVRMLISDGCQTMSVELEFQAEGRLYRVMRSTSRTAYPPPVHRLICLSDSQIAPLDREDLVNREIERLIGMDYKGFLAAVILPQGRFQTLLMAAAAERTRILKGIFRLDDIDRAREIADALAAEARPLLAARYKDRSRFREKPTEAAERAEHSANQEVTVEAQLRDLRSDIKAHEGEVDAVSARGLVLGEKLAAVKRSPRGSGDLLRGLLPVASDIRGRQAETASAKDKLVARESQLEGSLAAANEAGEGMQQLRTAFSAIDKVEAGLQTVAQRRVDLKRESDSITSETGGLAELQKALSVLVGEAQAANTDQQLGEVAYQAAETDLRTATSMLGQVRTQALELASLRNAINECLDGLAKRRSEELPFAVEKAKGVVDQLRLAREHLEYVVKAGAVSRAAEGLQPGQPCPVCAQRLPHGFTPPHPPDDRKARQAVSGAEKADRIASEAVVRITSEITVEEAATQTEQSRAGALDRKYQEALGRLLAVVPRIDLSKPDDILLRPLVDTFAASKLQLETAKDRSRQTNDAKVRAESQLRLKSDELERRNRELERAQRETETAERTALRDLGTILPPHRPDPDQPNSFASKKQELQAAIDALQGLVDELDSCRREIRGMDSSLETLRRRWQDEVEAARQKAVRNLDGLRSRVNDCLDLLSLEPVADVGEAELADLTDWAGKLELRAIEVVDRLNPEVEELQKKRAAEEKVVATLLQKFEYRTTAELDEAIIQAAARVVSSTNEAKAARAEIEPAAALDLIIQVGDALIGDLDELSRLLTDGQFIGHVIARRQRNLLVAASEILGSMTGSRYGFSADFQVVDRVSNQPRPTRTLSGGESFLASLALALGLVEMAARAGGKLDALFLDEGFGSLDLNSLDQAMGALQRRATSGQLVAVVSHLRAVAEQIETVLRVTKTPRGSELAFVKGSERREFVEEEVQAGLLS